MLRIEEEKIERLKEYFEKEDAILLAFVFGSRAKGVQRPFSDWDFTKEFFEIRERSRSLSEEDRAILSEHIAFLENEDSSMLYPIFIERAKGLMKGERG